MEFKDLYHLSEKLMKAREDAGAFKPVSLVELKPEIVSQTSWLEAINIYGVDCKEGDPRGHIEFYGNQESRWEDPDEWVALITYDNLMNMCERRFVCFKEAMHIFDDQNSYTCSRDKYFELLSDIETRPTNPSSAYFSEVIAKWMALLVLCPKHFQEQAIRMKEADRSEYEIALKHRIPEAVVSSLLSKHYDAELKRLLK